MAKCGICGDEVPGRGIFRHRQDKHPEEFETARRLGVANSARNRRKNGNAPQEEKLPKGQSAPTSPAGVKPTQSLDDASIIAIAPRRFEMTSTLLWQARAAAIREWHWPANITPEDFLDTFLFEAFKQCGILLGAYQVISREEGNGHR